MGKAQPKGWGRHLAHLQRREMLCRPQDAVLVVRRVGINLSWERCATIRAEEPRGSQGPVAWPKSQRCLCWILRGGRSRLFGYSWNQESFERLPSRGSVESKRYGLSRIIYWEEW